MALSDELCEFGVGDAVACDKGSDIGGGGSSAASTVGRKVVPTTITMREADNGSCTVLKISTADRPGVLLDIVRVLKDVNTNVVSAEIDTVGDSVEDEFFVTYHGEPLNASMTTLVTNALQASNLWSPDWMIGRLLSEMTNTTFCSPPLYICSTTWPRGRSPRRRATDRAPGRNERRVRGWSNPAGDQNPAGLLAAGSGGSTCACAVARRESVAAPAPSSSAITSKASDPCRRSVRAARNLKKGPKSSGHSFFTHDWSFQWAGGLCHRSNTSRMARA